jgi:hypothetical protein
MHLRLVEDSEPSPTVTPPSQTEGDMVQALIIAALAGEDTTFLARRLRNTYPDKTVKGPVNEPPPTRPGGARIAIAA